MLFRFIALSLIGFLLFSCKSSPVDDDFSKPILIDVSGSSRSPRVDLPHYEYPFDAEGNYMVSWAQLGEKRAGRRLGAKKKKSVRRKTRDLKKKKKYVTRKAPSASRVHIVTRGDTLYGLSRRYSCGVGRIRSANGISGSTIYVGQRLKIPR